MQTFIRSSEKDSITPRRNTHLLCFVFLGAWLVFVGRWERNFTFLELTEYLLLAPLKSQLVSLLKFKKTVLLYHIYYCLKVIMFYSVIHVAAPNDVVMLKNTLRSGH